MGKVHLAQKCGRSVAAGIITEIGPPAAPHRPARPVRPQLLAPKHMPRRRAAGSRTGRIALYHALAHIELNAIDLAFDLIARFADPALPWAFYTDWARIGAEEAHHFELLNNRLAALDTAYGDLPAHGGLWEAASETDDDLLARLAVVPLVLEARGLDVTPNMITRLRGHDDGDGAAVLELILEEEIRHVAAGWRWFRWIAESRGLDAPDAWVRLVRTRFKGEIKPPFNQAARVAAGFDADWSVLALSPVSAEEQVHR
jgi:uncharacterized ferritin-like protein (DUF455 family)